MERAKIIKYNYNANSLFEPNNKISRTSVTVCSRLYLVFVINLQNLLHNRNHPLYNNLVNVIIQDKIKMPALFYILTDKQSDPIYYQWFEKINKHPSFKYYYSNDKKILIQKATAFYKKKKLSKSLDNLFNNTMNYYWNMYFQIIAKQLPKNIKFNKKNESYYLFGGIVKNT